MKPEHPIPLPTLEEAIAMSAGIYVQRTTNGDFVMQHPLGDGRHNRYLVITVKNDFATRLPPIAIWTRRDVIDSYDERGEIESDIAILPNDFSTHNVVNNKLAAGVTVEEIVGKAREGLQIFAVYHAADEQTRKRFDDNVHDYFRESNLLYIVTQPLIERVRRRLTEHEGKGVSDEALPMEKDYFTYMKRVFDGSANTA